jgi:hypothetical protein
MHVAYHVLYETHRIRTTAFLVSGRDLYCTLLAELHSLLQHELLDFAARLNMNMNSTNSGIIGCQNYPIYIYHIFGVKLYWPCLKGISNPELKKSNKI